MAKVVKEEKEKVSIFNQTVADLEAKFGRGTLIKGNSVKEDLEVVDSGSLMLNLATNIGGIPVGKLIELVGMESAGKSTLILHILAEFQKRFSAPDNEFLLIDTEHSFDIKYAKALGVDINRLTISQPNYKEDCYNIAERLIKTGNIRLVLFDSHTSSRPKAVIEGEVGDATIGMDARINSTALSKLKPHLMLNRCTLISISQMRNKIGKMFGNPLEATGGEAYKFYSDMRFELTKRIDTEGQGNKTTVKVVKNKCGVPFGIAEFDIAWGKGICREKEIFDLAVEYGFIQKGGAWFTISEGNKIQGEDKVRQFMLDNIEYSFDLEQRILNKINGK